MQAPDTHSREYRILVIDRESPDYLRDCRSAAEEWDIVVSANLRKCFYRLILNAFDLVVLDLTREDSPVAAIRELNHHRHGLGSACRTLRDRVCLRRRRPCPPVRETRPTRPLRAEG
jgi:hypothetical protein